MAIFKNKSNNYTELGFGNTNDEKSTRLLNSDGSVNIERKGLGWLNHFDIFHWLISISIKQMVFFLIFFYAFINIFFASIYFIIGAKQFGGLESYTELETFFQLIYFSSQTITSVGYGHVYPIGNLSGIVSSLESFTGLALFALITGVVFGRFSRPKSELIYSKNILIAPYKNIKALMFRVANIKQYELIENEAKVAITFTNHQTNKREFYVLPLEISSISFMPLSWTIVHPIDEESPLFNLNAKQLLEKNIEVIILIKGINETLSQIAYSRMSYKGFDIVENSKFKPLESKPNKKGKLTVSIDKIHLYEPTEAVKLS